MALIKIFFKLLALPLIAAVTLIQWVGIFLAQFSTVIFNLLAGLMFLIAVAGRMIGIGTGAETLQMMTVAFVVFIIPHIAEWLIIRIAAINYGLRDFIKSRPHNFILTKKRQVFPCEVSVAFIFTNIQGGKINENVYERKESPLCLWLSEP